MLGSIVTGVLVAAVPILLGLIVYQWQQRVNRREEERRNKRVQVTEYLTEAYRSIYAIGPAGGIGGLTTEEKKGVERAFRDAYLFGNARVASEIGKLMEWADGDRSDGYDTGELIAALIEQLRELYQLSKAESRVGIPWIQTQWRPQAEVQKILDNAKDIDALDRLVTLDQSASYLRIPPDDLIVLTKNGRLPAPIGLKGTLFWPAEVIIMAADELHESRYSPEQWEQFVRRVKAATEADGSPMEEPAG